ncbi:hypothetical protein N0V83_010193 [Neocucurbitaria cava]|uniref:NACHT domain-containing protein n=1 Tax=Neocucurbitaria cava TaxID=798079 RepID=A0A9W9CHW7_9PLEO|nr:hypothetical protein N0V83_010193 [Neocucurbitaria cava]
MEPFSVIALTGNILQFVERVAVLISASRELSVSGAKQEHIELSTIAEELRSLVLRVTPAELAQDTLPSDDEKSIRLLGEQCNEVAQELLCVLESLKVKEKDGHFRQIESFHKVLLSEWKKPKIVALQGRLDRIGTNIQTHISSYDSGKILGRLDELSAQNRFLQSDRKSDISQLRKELRGIFGGIGKKLQENESRNRTMTALLSAVACGSQYAAEQFVLEQLRFEEIDYRYANIREAHNHTLSWVVDTGEQHSPATFDDWLSSDDNLYWISGKPGSGKSTLMKFLHDNPRNLEKLQTWTKQKRLIRAAYFFWDAGKSIQKSQEGLLRSLLFDILRQNPDLIPQVYPNIWRLFFSSRIIADTSTSRSNAVTMSLSVPGLLDALKVACNIAAGLDTRFCFLIDGLDEYEGQANDMIEFIALLRNLPDVKICVSSRPWNEFECEFGKDGSQKLYMQDYNGLDIEKYVYDILDKDGNYQELEDKEAGDLLVREIVQAANGVFLWVFLVVRSFQEGLENGDRVFDLRERLRKLPSDLNEYFNRIILSDVAEFYHGHSAEMFLVTLEGHEDIPLMAYWFIREDPKYVLDLERKPLSMQQVNKRLRDTAKRLNACCKGLLEIQGTGFDHRLFGDTSLPSSIFFARKVGFLHRTVREYLQLGATRSVLHDWCSANFEPHETSCKVLLAQIKISPDDDQYHKQVSHLGNLFRNHRRLIPPSSDGTIITALTDEFHYSCRDSVEGIFSTGITGEEKAQVRIGSEVNRGKGKISKLVSRMRNKLRMSLR